MALPLCLGLTQRTWARCLTARAPLAQRCLALAGFLAPAFVRSGTTRSVDRIRFALQVGVAGALAHLGAHLVVGRPGGAAEVVGGFEVAVAAGAVAAEGEPAVALADLEDDDDFVVVGAGDVAFEVGEFAVADDRAARRAGSGGRPSAGWLRPCSSRLVGAVDRAELARGPGRDREAVAAALVGEGDAEEFAAGVGRRPAEDADGAVATGAARAACRVPARVAALALLDGLARLTAEAGAERACRRGPASARSRRSAAR